MTMVIYFCNQKPFIFRWKYRIRHLKFWDLHEENELDLIQRLKYFYCETKIVNKNKTKNEIRFFCNVNINVINALKKSASWDVLREKSLESTYFTWIQNISVKVWNKMHFLCGVFIWPKEFPFTNWKSFTISCFRLCITSIFIHFL